MLEAARSNPLLVIPQVALLLAKSEHFVETISEDGPESGVRYWLVRDRLDAIFGEHALEVLQLLAAATSNEDYVRHIGREARNLL